MVTPNRRPMRDIVSAECVMMRKRVFVSFAISSSGSLKVVMGGCRNMEMLPFSPPMMEISSGTEVLKRLIRSDFIIEKPDEKDRRAKRLFLSDKGRDTIVSAFYEMYKASKIIRGNLSDDELSYATQVMEKLSTFHWHIHQHDKTSGMDILLDKYINN